MTTLQLCSHRSAGSQGAHFRNRQTEAGRQKDLSEVMQLAEARVEYFTSSACLTPRSPQAHPPSPDFQAGREGQGRKPSLCSRSKATAKSGQPPQAVRSCKYQPRCGSLSFMMGDDVISSLTYKLFSSTVTQQASRGRARKRHVFRGAACRVSKAGLASSENKHMTQGLVALDKCVLLFWISVSPVV